MSTYHHHIAPRRLAHGASAHLEFAQDLPHGLLVLIPLFGILEVNVVVPDG